MEISDVKKMFDGATLKFVSYYKHYFDFEAQAGDYTLNVTYGGDREVTYSWRIYAEQTLGSEGWPIDDLDCADLVVVHRPTGRQVFEHYGDA